MWDHGPNLSGNRVKKEISVFTGQKKRGPGAPLKRFTELFERVEERLNLLNNMLRQK